MRAIWELLKSLLGKPRGIEVSMTLPGFDAKSAPPPGLLESRDLTHAHPELVRRYLLVKAEYQLLTGRVLVETGTWRSLQRQVRLFSQGRTTPGQIVTRIDGVTSKSRHQVFPSEAVDVAVDTDPGPGKFLSWDPRMYEALGPLCVKHGLIWGGSWSFKDYPHIELPAGVA